MRSPDLPRVLFVGALIFFGFLYGVATQAFGWFPSGVLARAWDQAKVVAPARLIPGADSDGEGSWGEPRVYERAGARTDEPDRVAPGLTLIASAWETADGRQPGLRLIDRRGETLHEWPVSPSELFPTEASSDGGLIHGTHLLPDGDVLVNVEYVGAARLDACGEVVWTNTEYNFHHSIARDPDGSFWIPGVRRSRPPKSEEYPDGYPGLQGPVHHSLIVHLSPDGSAIDTINVMDVVFASDLERHIAQSMLGWNESRPYVTDVLHLNDVEPLPDSMAAEYPLFEGGDLVVSLRDPNLIFVLDPDSRTVKWHASAAFIDQHDPDFVGGGRIGVFDNNRDGTRRGSMLGGSRIVFLEPHTDSVATRFPTSRSDPFYTPLRGKWQLLANGNLLLTEAQAGRVAEVSPDGETVWEWIHEPVGEGRVAPVTGARRYPFAKERVESWPCSPGEASP